MSAQRIGLVALRQRPFSVDRLAEGVDHAAEPGLARMDDGIEPADIGAAAHAHAFEHLEGHAERALILKAGDLARHEASAPPPHRDPRANAERARGARYFDQQALHPRHTPITLDGVDLLDLTEKRFH
jgi:hypothetical protein